MDIIVSSLITRNAVAWGEISSSKFIGNVNYRPFLDITILKEITLNPTKRTCTIEGEEY